MKKVFALGVAFLFVAMKLTGQDGAAGGETRDRFVGAWRLAELDEQGADLKIHRLDCSGLLVFTYDGHMSVQVMYRNPPAGPEAATAQYSQGGYEASFGTYAVDERNHSFTFHVEGALVRTLIGKDLSRKYELSGKQLIVTSANPDEHWKVAWERDYHQ